MGGGGGGLGVMVVREGNELEPLFQPRVVFVLEESGTVGVVAFSREERGFDPLLTPTVFPLTTFSIHA